MSCTGFETHGYHEQISDVDELQTGVFYFSHSFYIAVKLMEKFASFSNWIGSNSWLDFYTKYLNKHINRCSTWLLYLFRWRNTFNFFFINEYKPSLKFRFVLEKKLFYRNRWIYKIFSWFYSLRSKLIFEVSIFLDHCAFSRPLTMAMVFIVIKTPAKNTTHQTICRSSWLIDIFLWCMCDAHVIDGICLRMNRGQKVSYTKFSDAVVIGDYVAP